MPCVPLALLPLLAACSDYGLKGDVPEVTLAADIEVDPAALDRVLCGPEYEWLTIRNVGDAALLLTAVTSSGEGWALDTTALPESLGPGEDVALPLTAGVGEATVFVESSDPDEPLVEIPLVGRADAPPTVHIDSPTSGSILASGEALALRGRVTDGEDAAEALSLSWTSDVDGLLGADPPLPDGSTELTWAGEDRTAGPHVLALAATDSCGQEAVATVEICQDEGYTVDELDISSWHLEGAATWVEEGSYLRLTEALTDQVGTAFAIDETVSGDAVDIRFRFWMGGGSGADGISLTVLDVDRMSTFLGGTGCGIGYGGDASCTSGPALPGWSIEVDTYYNGGQDPTDADHVMFTFDGDVDDPAIWAPLPEMEDTGWHEMVVTVAAPRVTVAIDGVTYVDTDLAGFTPFRGYVGFTAGTGGETNEHLIDSLQVTAHTCE